MNPVRIFRSAMDAPASVDTNAWTRTLAALARGPMGQIPRGSASLPPSGATAVLRRRAVVLPLLVAAMVGVALALMMMQPAPAAQAQGPVVAQEFWSTTITFADDEGIPAFFTTLTGSSISDHDFEYEGVTYSIVALSVGGSITTLGLNKTVPESLWNNLAIAIKGTVFQFGDGLSRPLGFSWSTPSSLSVPVGEMVKVSILVNVPLEVEVGPLWLHRPAGLTAGDKFRLLFVTYGGWCSVDGQPGKEDRRPPLRSTDIDEYNDYVQCHAEREYNHRVFRDNAQHFRALVSTPSEDARDNTGTTTTSSDSGVPIYWVGGNPDHRFVSPGEEGPKIADDYTDFYDGTWDGDSECRWHYPFGNGRVLKQVRRIHTGTSSDGTGHAANELGSSGNAGAGTLRPLSSGSCAANDGMAGPIGGGSTLAPHSEHGYLGYYGLSPIFKVRDIGGM